MVISSALLLARCCCIFMLLLSFANVAKYTNSALVSATAPSSANARATPSNNDPNENGESDPCFLNQVAPKDGWTRKSKRSEGLCEYHLNFDQLDHEHLVQLNLSLGPVFEMTTGGKLQERRTTSTHRITTASVSGTGSPFRHGHAPKPPVNNNNSNYNGEYNNVQDQFGPESSLTHRGGNSNASEHSRKPLGSHTIDPNQTLDSSLAEKSADYSQRDDDFWTFSFFHSSHPGNASQGENNSNDESSTLKANRSDSGHYQEASSPEPPAFCPLTLIFQWPNEKQPQKLCIQNVSRENLIYYLRDVLNVTITWDRRFLSEVHLTYAMVPAKGVKCRNNCGKKLCLFESRLCESPPDCSEAANEERKECGESRPSPQAQHEQSARNIVLIVLGVVVLIILVVCCCFLMRRNRCQLSRDALLRQQQRPHSHSSEMYRSPSGIMQDTSGQYDPRVALLHDRHHQTPSSHAHPSPHAQSSPPTGITNSHQQQPSVSLPSHHHHAPLSPYFQPPQSSLLPCNGSDRQAPCPFLFQNMSKPSRSPHHTYPHQIAMSRDGEEGFKASQQALHSSHQQHQNFLAQTEVFRAPPNKTVFDRGSPPPPYSFKAPHGSKSPDLLVRGMSGVNVPRLVCSSSSSNNNNNNNSKHNNNNNMDKCKNQGSPPSLSAPAGSQVSCPPPPASIYPPNRLSASGPPPDYHQVAATRPRSKHNPSDLPVPLPSRQGAPPLGPTSRPSPEGPFSPMRPSPIFCGFSPMADSSNTFVVTNGSPSVCPGPDRSTTTHRSPGSENGGDHGTESAQTICAQPASWSSVTTVPSSQSSALSIETPLLTSSPTIISSSSPSSHVPVLLNLSLPSSSLSFSHGVDSGRLCASATTIATPALDSQAPGHHFNNNNNNNITINNNNDNNINDNHHHNNFNMNNLATGHCNNVVNNNSSNNNNDSYCNNNNNNNNNSNDLECVANNCGVSSDDSPRLTPSKALLLVPATLASSPSHVSTHLTLITTMPFSSLSSLPPHHQHLQTHRHRPIHIQPACQSQPSWPEASQGVSFNPTSVHRGTPNPPQSPSPPTAVTNSEYDHVAQARSGAVLCSESNGNVFLGHDPLLSALAASPAVVTGVLDPNGNNSEGQMVRDSRGLPSSSSSSSQGYPDVAMLDPNENCDWSKSLEALSTSPLVSSSADPHVDSSPCCDNISAATTTTTATTSSPSSSSPSSPTASSSSTFGVLPPRNVVDPGPTDDGDGDATANVAADSSGSQTQKGNATTAASQEEEEDVVEVVVVTKSRHSPTCTAAQERVE